MSNIIFPKLLTTPGNESLLYNHAYLEYQISMVVKNKLVAGPASLLQVGLQKIQDHQLHLRAGRGHALGPERVVTILDFHQLRKSPRPQQCLNHQLALIRGHNLIRLPMKNQKGRIVAAGIAGRAAGRQLFRAAPKGQPDDRFEAVIGIALCQVRWPLL